MTARVCERSPATCFEPRDELEAFFGRGHRCDEGHGLPFVCVEPPFAWADALGMLTASERYTAALEAFMAPHPPAPGVVTPVRYDDGTEGFARVRLSASMVLRFRL